MSDSSGPESGPPAAESPLDRLRRLAKESTAAKATATQPQQPAAELPLLVEEAPPFDEPAFDEPAFDEPSFDEPGVAEPAFTEPVQREPLPEPVPEPEPDPEPDPEPHAQPTSEVATEPAPRHELADVGMRPGPPSNARRRPEPQAPAIAPEPAGEMASATSAEAGSPRGLKALAATLALLVVLAAVGLIFAIRHEHNSNRAADDRAAATAAAIKMISDITSLDYRNLDSWLTRVQADSTDGSSPGKGLRSEYANDKDSLGQVASQQKSVSVGGVVKSVYCGGYCATSQVAGNTASSLVYGTAKVTSTTTPAGTTQVTRFTVKLIKANGHWLASNVDEAALAPTS